MAPMAFTVVPAVSFHVAYALHPTPYNLHPLPYTLHLTPYTLNPILFTLHPAPSLSLSHTHLVLQRQTLQRSNADPTQKKIHLLATGTEAPLGIRG